MIERKSISSEQEKDLNIHERLGADCFVLCSFSPTHVYRIPWPAFRDMKTKLGRLFVKEDEVAQLGGERLSVRGGIIHIFWREEQNKCRISKE